MKYFIVLYISLITIGCDIGVLYGQVNRQELTEKMSIDKTVNKKA